MRSFRLYACTFVAIVALATTSTFAQDKQVTAPTPTTTARSAIETAKSLLHEHWEKGLANKEASTETFEPHQGDSDVLLAYTLNRMQHRKYSEALTTARTLTIREPENLDGWVLRIWLDALRDNYDPSLVAMRSLRERMDNTPNLAEEKKNETLRRLGRLIGYMQGPVNGKVNQDMLNAAMAATTKSLDKNQMKLFNDAREETLKKFEEISTKNTQKLNDEVEKVKVADQVQSDLIANQNADMKERIKELEPRLQALEDEGYAALERVRAESAPLERESGYLNNQLNSQIFALDRLYNDYYFIQNNQRPNQGQNPNLYYINLQIQDRQLAVNSIRRQIRNVNRQLSAIRDRENQVRNSYANRIDEVENELKRIGYVRKKNDKKLLKIAKGPQVARGKSGALSSRALALTTYDPFPLELLREEVLQQLK